MGQPAARIGDMHTCPIHAGGPVLTGQVNVLIGGMPAARITDKALCVNSPPDVIIEGEPTVLIGGKPASRIGDKTVHGGIYHTIKPCTGGWPCASQYLEIGQRFIITPL